MDLKEKICLITGANSGLGFEVSKQMAARGAQIIMVCRSKSKGDLALSRLRKEKPDASVELMICDLSSIKSIQEFIRKFRTNHSKLDVLYNNAAVMKQKRTITEDGFEMMFQVNYLAPFIFMRSFQELLRKGSSPCIVNNGRPADKLRLDLDDLQFERNYKMYQSFFKSKLCLLFSTLELSRKSEIGDISVMMIDPGPFKSDLVRDMPLAGRVKNLFSAPVEKAAENLLHHIILDDIHTRNGKVFKEKQEYPITDYWKDIELAEQLWTLTESLIQDKTN